MERSADWMARAENDIEWARHSARDGFHAQACFAAQQAAGKAVKAVLQACHGEARGHGILRLLQALPVEGADSEELAVAASELDQYSISTRYPNGFASGAPFQCFREPQSRLAIEHAERVVAFCRRELSRLLAVVEATWVVLV